MAGSACGALSRGGRGVHGILRPGPIFAIGPRPRSGIVKARGGRTTPKKAAPSGRYTPPIPKSKKVSPRWVPALMFTCLLLGVAIVILNYLPHVLPGGTSNWYLLLGLGLITAGFVTATQYH